MGIFMVYKPLSHILFHLQFDLPNNLVKGRLSTYSLWVRKLRLGEAELFKTTKLEAVDFCLDSNSRYRILKRRVPGVANEWRDKG